MTAGAVDSAMDMITAIRDLQSSNSDSRVNNSSIKEWVSAKVRPPQETRLVDTSSCVVAAVGYYEDDSPLAIYERVEEDEVDLA